LRIAAFSLKREPMQEDIEERNLIHPKQMEDTIIKLLEQWQKKRERDMSR